MQYPLLNPSRRATRLCLLSALAIGTACGDDVSSTETQSPSTGSTSSDSTTSTTASPTTEQADTTTTTSDGPDSSTTASVDPDSSSTLIDPTEETVTRGDSSSGDEGSTSTGENESSSTGPGKMAQDCPYGDLTAPDLVTDTTLDQDSEFATSCGGGGAPDYSYLLTAPADGFYVITASSDDGVDPIIAAFDGDCGGPEIACNNGEGNSSEIGIQLTEGQVVTVVADGFAVTGGVVDVSVTFFAGTCPDADIGNTVPAVFMGDTTMSDNTVFGTCGGDTGLDDTLTFTAPEDGVYAINTEGSTFDTIMYIRDECDGTELACNDNVEGGVTSGANLNLTAGQQIVVAVDGAGLESGTYTVNIDRDECPDVTLASMVPQTVSGSTVGEIDASSGSCGGLGAPGSSYSFTAPEPGVYTIETANSDFDTVLYAISSCGGAETQCNNDAGAGTDSRINVTLAQDEEVLFVVDGANGESGAFDIVIGLDECPDFDLGNAAPTMAAGNNEAELDSSFTDECGSTGGLDVAYTFTAPSTGTYLFDTNGSNYDTVLYAFDGATCAADGTLGCNDDGGDGTQSLLALSLVQDQEITVVVDGFSGASQGDYELNVTPIICGDGTIDFGEECDSDDLDGATCTTLGLAGDGLACDPVTCTYDAAACDTCGTETVEGEDECDGTALGETRCEDYGFAGGSLDCDDGCTANTDQCSDDVVVMCSSPGAALDSNLPPATDTITIVGAGTIADVDVFVDAAHSYVGDLDITLTADDLGVSNDLVLDTCFGADDVWAFFNDEGSSPVGTVCDVPFGIEGNLIPASPLSAYDGQAAAGDWTLSITDTTVLDTGTFNEWCVYITLED